MAARMRRDARGRFLPRARRNENNPRHRRYARNEPNPPRRRRYRRNPDGITPGGIVARLIGGLQKGAVVVVGDALSSMAPGFLKQDKASPIGMLIQLGAGGVLAMAAEMAGLRRWSELLVAGAGAGVARRLFVRFNVPFIGPALSEYPDLVELPAADQAVLSAYPALAGSQSTDIYGTALAGYPPPQYTQ